MQKNIMFTRIENTFSKSAKPTIQPYVELSHRSQESVESSKSLFPFLRFNPQRGFQSLAISNSSKRKLIVRSSVDPGPPGPSDSPLIGLSWVFAVVLAVVVPFVNYKWGISLKNRIEAKLKMTEDLAEAVAEVAEVVEKVAEDVAEDLPKGGKLREAVDFVEKLAERTAKDAGAVDDFLDKVEEEEERTESLVDSLKSVNFKRLSKELSDEAKSPTAQPIATDDLKKASQNLKDKLSNDL